MFRPPCKICGSKDQRTVGHFGSVPLILNVAYESFDAARSAETGTVEIVRCETCGLVWNFQFDPSLVKFEKSYENTQDLSATFARHVAAAARSVIEVTPSNVAVRYLEIGCGQGFFLKHIIELLGHRLEAAQAFDPAWRGSPVVSTGGSISIHDTYFDASLLKQRPNLIVMRHSFEYFPDPIALLRILRAVSDENTLLFVETPSVESMFARRAIEDFGYERQHFFGQRSLRLALERGGWNVRALERVFSDQYLWVFGSTDQFSVPISIQEAIDVPSAFLSDYRIRWCPILRDAHRRGKMAIWGTGAKGAMFSVLNDPDGALLDCGIDINPHRHGKFLPVSGLPIVSPTQAAQRDLETIFVMNPAYLAEIREQAAESGIKAHVSAGGA